MSHTPALLHASMIFEAAAAGESHTVREILTQRPTAHRAYNADGFTPLQLAAFFGHTETVRLLLECGADPAQRSKNALFLQALYSAASAGHVEAASVLLKAGADPNAKKHGGYTPLLAAMLNRDCAMMALLRNYGARP